MLNNPQSPVAAPGLVEQCFDCRRNPQTRHRSLPDDFPSRCMRATLGYIDLGFMLSLRVSPQLHFLFILTTSVYEHMEQIVRGPSSSGVIVMLSVTSYDMIEAE